MHDDDDFDPGIPVQEIVNHLTAIGVYSKHDHRPVFGWSPVLKGWFISVDNRNTTPLNERIRINLVPWDPSIPIPWGENNPYAEAHRKLRGKLRATILSLASGAA